MRSEAMNVLGVGLGADLDAELTGDDGLVVGRARGIGAVTADGSVDAVVIELGDAGPLETLETLRSMMPGAAVLVVTDPDRQADLGEVVIAAEDGRVLKTDLHINRVD